jgi:phospholipid/cholesterol/gamma-HCH transport system substrate-binding protein
MKIKTEIRIGFIVLATIALVIWGINYLKGKNVLKRTDVYYAVFDDISGLKLSGSIFIMGMKVGVINNIDFNENNYDKIIVALAVNKGITIPKNSTIELFSSDIMGNKALRILPSGEKENAKYGDTLVSSVQLDLVAGLQSELIPFKEKAEHAIVSLDSLVNTFKNIMDPVTQKKLQQSIGSLNESTGSLAKQLAPGGSLQQTINSLMAFSKTLSDNKEKLKNVFTNLEEITDSVASSNLKSAILNMNKTFEQTQILLSGINSGKGSLGLLATNDSLYHNLESASNNLSVLLEDLNKNPKRYVHFSIFGKKDKVSTK